jgi:hypothetical protein
VEKTKISRNESRNILGSGMMMPYCQHIRLTRRHIQIEEAFLSRFCLTNCCWLKMEKAFFIDLFLNTHLIISSRCNFPNLVVLVNLMIMCSRGHWRPNEDQKLRELVSCYGPHNWNAIAQFLPDSWQ